MFVVTLLLTCVYILIGASVHEWARTSDVNADFSPSHTSCRIYAHYSIYARYSVFAHPAIFHDISLVYVEVHVRARARRQTARVTETAAQRFVERPTFSAHTASLVLRCTYANAPGYRLFKALPDTEKPPSERSVTLITDKVSSGRYCPSLPCRSSNSSSHLPRPVLLQPFSGIDIQTLFVSRSPRPSPLSSVEPTVFFNIKFLQIFSHFVLPSWLGCMCWATLWQPSKRELLGDAIILHSGQMA